MVNTTEQRNFKFYLMLMNLHLNVNSSIWLVTTVADSAVLDIFFSPVHLHMYVTDRPFCIFVFYISFHALCILLLLAFFG